MLIEHILEQKGDRIVTATSDSTIALVAKTMAAEQIGTVMLTDKGGQLEGILSERDLVKFIARHGSDALGMRASALMRSPVITCTARTGIEDVMALMSKHTIRHLPVVQNGRILGLVSARDIMDFQREMMVVEIEARKHSERKLRRAKEAS